MKSPAELSRRLLCLRAAVLGLLALAAWVAQAPAATLPDKSAAAALLDHFRQSVWIEPVYATFDLKQMPRRGEVSVTHGRFWGSRNDDGPVTRIELSGAGGAFSHRILIQGGRDGGVWTSDGPGPGKPDQAAVLAPLVPGVEMTPFDFLPMPYLYWLDYELAAVERIRGRPAYVYVFTPSADFSDRYPAVKSVRAYLDTQYDALVQSETMGPAGKVAKTLSLLELRKVGDRWIPKDVDVRNEATRDKTRLSLTAVSVGAAPGPSAFDPAQLGAPLAPPPSSGIMRVSP